VADIELKGVDGILNKLQQIGTNISRLENKALKNAAEPVLEDAKATNAFNDRSGKLRKGLKISNIKSIEGTKYIQVDVWSKSDYTEVVEKVENYMKVAEFTRTSAADLFEEDTKIYHKVMRFFIQIEGRQ